MIWHRYCTSLVLSVKKEFKVNFLFYLPWIGKQTVLCILYCLANCYPSLPGLVFVVCKVLTRMDYQPGRQSIRGQTRTELGQTRVLTHFTLNLQNNSMCVEKSISIYWREAHSEDEIGIVENK